MAPQTTGHIPYWRLRLNRDPAAPPSRNTEVDRRRRAALLAIREARRAERPTMHAVSVQMVEALLANRKQSQTRRREAAKDLINPAPHRLGQPKTPTDLTPQLRELQAIALGFAGRFARGSDAVREELAQDAFVHAYLISLAQPGVKLAYLKQAVWNRLVDQKREARQEREFLASLYFMASRLPRVQP